MAKIHRAFSPNPLTSGTDLTAFCGAVIPKADAINMEAVTDEEFTSMIVFCKICFGTKYEYFLISGQEGFDESRREFALESPKPKTLQTDFPVPEEM